MNSTKLMERWTIFIGLCRKWLIWHINGLYNTPWLSHQLTLNYVVVHIPQRLSVAPYVPSFHSLPLRQQYVVSCIVYVPIIELNCLPFYTRQCGVPVGTNGNLQHWPAGIGLIAAWFWHIVACLQGWVFPSFCVCVPINEPNCLPFYTRQCDVPVGTNGNLQHWPAGHGW